MARKIQATSPLTKQSFWARLKKNIRDHFVLYIFVLPAVLVTLIFSYIPMYGIQIAFKDYDFALGITGSPWTRMHGFYHFYRFVNSMDFWNIITNTVTLSIGMLIFSFPFPIILALMLNSLKNERSKKLMQTVTYMPHFISMVVMVGMVILFLSPSNGLYGHFMRLLGQEPRNIMADPNSFAPVYIISGIWQGTGWNSIIYLAALSSVDPNLYEAARMDGASKLKIVWNIELPHLAPTIIMLLILQCGRIMQVGFEKVYLMQNQLNLAASEVISTYVYKVGMGDMNYSYSTAISLFNTIVNFTILMIVNRIAKTYSESSLW